MGHKGSAALAHTVTKAITLCAIKLSQATPSDINYDIIIDDIAFMAKDEQTLNAVLSHFDAICKTFKFSIGQSTTASTTFTHRGVDWDLKHKLQSLKVGFITKFRDRIAILSEKPSKARAESVLGMILYGARIIDTHTAPLDLKTTARYTPENFKDRAFEATAQIINTNTPRHTRPCDGAPYGGVLYADATPTTWASIFVNEKGDVSSVTGTFPSKLPIHTAEALATFYGTQELIPQFRVRHNIQIVTDNTVWLFSMENYWARVPELQTIRTTFLQRCEHLNIYPIPAYIKTHLNPADEPSRGLSIDLNKLHTSTLTPKELKETMEGGRLRRPRTGTSI